MSSPNFVPQDDTNFTAIRYYTAADPYYYVIDNRPLQDIETNLKASRTGGADAARRAVLNTSLNLSSIQSDLYTAPASSGAARVMTGLIVSSPSTGTIRIGPGAVFEQRSINDALTTNLVTKQAQITINTDFNIVGPVGAGTSIVYTIEGKYNDLTATDLATTTLPYMDATNAYLPSTLLNGELTLGIVVGTAATTGTQVPAATTSGKYPLYNITLTFGSSVPTVTLHANAPYMKGLSQHTLPVALTSGGAVIGVTNETPSVTFAEGSTTGVILPITGVTGVLNPFKPVKVKLTFASTTSSGSVALRLRYKGFAVGDLLTAALTTTALEPVAITGSANAIQSYTTLTAVVPNTEFAGFVNGVWVNNKEKLEIILERVSADVTDTSTGNLVVINTFLTQ